MLIHDVTWWRKMQSGEDGYKLNTPETHDNLLLISLEDDDDSMQSQLADNYFLSMVPQAIPAFWEGLARARILIKQKN